MPRLLFQMLIALLLAGRLIMVPTASAESALERSEVEAIEDAVPEKADPETSAPPTFDLPPQGRSEIENLRRCIESLEKEKEKPQATPGLPTFVLPPQERGEIENLRRRIERLEAEKEKPEVPLLVAALAKRLLLSGFLVVEAFYAKVEGGDEVSDLALSTAQIAAEATVNEFISGRISLLHEEEEGEVVVIDEAVITLGCFAAFCPGYFSLSGGRMYLPFGMFNSHFISNPLTLELGETHDTALYVGWELAERLDLKLGVFAGESDTVGDDEAIDSFVASLEGSVMQGFTLGASFISDLAESDIGLVSDESPYRSSVPGAAAFLTFFFGPFTLEGEYVAALRRFDAAVVAAGEDLDGSKPSAWNGELALAPNDRWEFAVKVDGANDFLDEPIRYGAVVSYGLFQNTVLALEYLLDDQKQGNEDRTHTVSTQLAFEF